MPEERELILVPEVVVEALVASNAAWGLISLTEDRLGGVGVLTGYSAGEGARYNVPRRGFVGEHYTRTYDPDGWQGAWYRVEPEVHAAWDLLRRQQAAIPATALSDQVQGWRQPPLGGFMRVLTIAVTEGVAEVRAWHIGNEVAQPALAVIVPEDPDVTPELGDAWPLDDLRSALYAIVGVGSIGEATAGCLPWYAVRRVALVDPDRLLPHNLVRHGAPRRWLGRHKVDAVRDMLLERFPYLEVEAYPRSVVDAADVMRGLFLRSSVVLCCADSVEARVVSSHLARWAKRPVVLACVLDDGAVGEVLRLRPGSSTGCLRCHRAHLRAAKGIDPEQGIDLPYGTGSRHRPMTAVGGDLHLVGQLAAKVAVATVLEAAGYPDQRLPGDHAIVALRPSADAAAPFDLRRAGEVRWLPVGPPRPGCPTCDAG